ncbi:MAG: pyridoxamine 5'-phosphate oxidase family protein [Desulfamplus sp.]|nr:pyridoxamine 5'-phosphate oxidase family protein [Desulfamplus sp.]
MIGDNEILNKAVALINQQSTMTLATYSKKGVWAAPVYYAFYKGLFFFFSVPETRHITEAIERDQASATIYSFSNTWQGISGIQMSGYVRHVSPSLTGIQAVKAYIKKFPFTMDFFENDQAPDLESFGKRFRVKLYRFDPTLVFYLENQIKFGFRTEIKFNKL